MRDDWRNRSRFIWMWEESCVPESGWQAEVDVWRLLYRVGAKLAPVINQGNNVHIGLRNTATMIK